jgi:hypothetical protein
MAKLLDPLVPQKEEAANQTPTAADYDIGNLTQFEGSVTSVTITPKTNKSTGTVTVYYEGTGSTTYPQNVSVPQTAGTYAVTFDVAAAEGWYAVSGLYAGILTITHIHNWGGWIVTTPATCTTEGEETRTCTLDPTHTEIRPIAALGHDWGVWTVTTAPTFETTGIETRTCTHNSAHKETRTIDKLPPLASAAALATWLLQQPPNTANEPYTVKLNVNDNDMTDLRTTLNNASDKYVYLDFSGSTIKEIPGNAFYDSSTNKGCATLTGITIPDSVESIGESAFDGCTSLTAITVDTNNASFSSQNGVLYNKDKTTLTQYPEGKTGAFTIPNSVTSIGFSAFIGCTSLTGVTIPDSVTSIARAAFYNCTSLANVTIGNGVTSIGEWAFFNCTDLTSVIFERAGINITYAKFPGSNSLLTAYAAGGIGTYTRASGGELWTKE